MQSPRDRCLFWVNCGSTYHALGDMEQAVEHSLLAEALLPEFEDPYLHAAVKMNLLLQRLILAVARRRRDAASRRRAHRAVAAFASQVERLVAAGQHYPVAKGSEDIADAYIALGQHEKAREALQIGVKSADAAKAGPDRGILELRLGRIERLAGQYRRASAHIGLALELLAESALLKELAEAHLENSLLNEERQHWRAALDSYRESAQIRERLLIAQSDARAHALTVRLELVRGRIGRLRAPADHALTAQRWTAAGRLPGLELVELGGVEVVVGALDGVLHRERHLAARLVEAVQAEVGHGQRVVELVVVRRALELLEEQLARLREVALVQRHLALREPVERRHAARPPPGAPVDGVGLGRAAQLAQRLRRSWPACAGCRARARARSAAPARRAPASPWRR